MLQASSALAGPLKLVNIALDLQILICTLLHPSDILALRETCKALQIPTRQRVVWVASLHRICLDNSLFLPSFPILEMSDAELEHAAIAPRRWIELAAVFQKRHLNDPDAILHPRTTRIIEDSLVTTSDSRLFIVPGGRYMVGYSLNGIVVWDLGYTSSSDCKLIASVGPEGGSYDCMVQATPDGMGLIIFSSRPYKGCSVYEIYPQSETPHLTHIAHLDFDPNQDCVANLLPDRVLWDEWYDDRIVFRVWDYRLNYSISFSADVDPEKVHGNIEKIVTKTAIIFLCVEEILIWAIPPLSPQPPNFFDHNPTHIPPLFRIAFPDGIVIHDKHVSWQTMSHWYSGSSQPLYFDILCCDSIIHKFELIVKPDLDPCLRLINTEHVLHDYTEVTFQMYMICEDTLVACWRNNDLARRGTYTGLTSSHGGSAVYMLLPPTSGRRHFLCPASVPPKSFLTNSRSPRYEDG